MLQNYRIHAYVNAKCCEDIKEDIKEGQIYILSNFKVKDFLGDETYRPVRNTNHIYFTKDTKIVKAANDDGIQIERYAFDLFHMKELKKLAADNRFLVDMVGVLKNRRQIVRTVKNEQQKYRLKFDLLDGRCTVNVTLFDKFDVDVDKSLDKAPGGDVIVIVACEKVNLFEGKPQLTNYPATRVYVQPYHYSVDILNKKLIDMLEISSVEEEVEKMVLNLGQITELEHDDNDRKVVCEVTVDDVVNRNQWPRPHGGDLTPQHKPSFPEDMSISMEPKTFQYGDKGTPDTARSTNTKTRTKKVDVVVPLKLGSKSSGHPSSIVMPPNPGSEDLVVTMKPQSKSTCLINKQMPAEDI
ncbi:hypothetical protein AgCh_030158 [Apium graveolens]